MQWIYWYLYLSTGHSSGHHTPIFVEFTAHQLRRRSAVNSKAPRPQNIIKLTNGMQVSHHSFWKCRQPRTFIFEQLSSSSASSTKSFMRTRYWLYDINKARKQINVITWSFFCFDCGVIFWVVVIVVIMSTSSGKKASKQSRSRHLRRRSVENVRPSARKERLWQLFGEIEREFDKLHQENLECTKFRTILSCITVYIM